METGFTHDFSCERDTAKLAELHPRPCLCPLWTWYTGVPVPRSVSEAQFFLKMAFKPQAHMGVLLEQSPMLRGSHFDVVSLDHS